MEACYPKLLQSDTLFDSILSLQDVDTSAGSFQVLLQFISKADILQAGSPFLPDFIEFHQWLHNDLAGVLTPLDARKCPISTLVRRMAKHYSGKRGEELQSLYNRVKGNAWAWHTN